MHSDGDRIPVTDGPNPSDTAAIEQAAALEQQVETNRRAVTDAAAQTLSDLHGVTTADAATLTRAVRLLLRLQLERFDGTD